MGQKNEEKSAVLDLDQGFKIVELKKRYDTVIF